MRNGVFIGACMWMLALCSLSHGRQEPITVDGKEYTVKADVNFTVCDDRHSIPCHPRAKGTRREEEAQVRVILDGKIIGAFPQICKTVGCKDDSREEWVRIAIRRQPK